MRVEQPLLKMITRVLSDTMTTISFDHINIHSACGWQVHQVTNGTYLSTCPGGNGDPVTLNSLIETCGFDMFIKYHILITERLFHMHTHNVLPSREFCMQDMCFSQDSIDSDHVHCAFMKVNDLIHQSDLGYGAKLAQICEQILVSLRWKECTELSTNVHFKQIFHLKSLTFSCILTSLLDGLSLMMDSTHPESKFEQEQSESIESLGNSLAVLLFDDEGDIKLNFNNLSHKAYVFLPVRDLNKPTSGRLGVKSFSVFIEDDNPDLKLKVEEAETAFRDALHQNMKAKFPNILRQFVIPNDSLFLFRLANSISVSQNFHVDTMHGFANSQYGCFVALNSNQTCHVYLERSTLDFEIVAPEMRRYHVNTFKSASFIHSGISCTCDGNSTVAVTWFQDCVLQYSTGSIRQLSSNTNSFGIGFEALCMSRIPSVT